MMILNIVQPKNLYNILKEGKFDPSLLDEFVFILNSDNEKMLEEVSDKITEIIENVTLQKHVIVDWDSYVGFFKKVQEYNIKIWDILDTMIELSTILGLTKVENESYEITNERYTQGSIFIQLISNYKLKQYEKDIFLKYNQMRFKEKALELQEQKKAEEQKGQEQDIMNKVLDKVTLLDAKTDRILDEIIKNSPDKILDAVKNLIAGGKIEDRDKSEIEQIVEKYIKITDLVEKTIFWQKAGAIFLKYLPLIMLLIR